MGPWPDAARLERLFKEELTYHEIASAIEDDFGWLPTRDQLYTKCMEMGLLDQRGCEAATE